MAKAEYTRIMTTNNCEFPNENNKQDEYLVDTSVWIEFLNGKPGPAVDQLKTWLTTGKVVGLTAAAFVLIQIAADLLYRAVDPRVA